jgi:hypothetical protein
MTANWEAILCILCSEPKDCGLICSCINGRLPTGVGWETLVLKIPGRGGVRQLYTLFILSVFFFLSMPLPLEWVVEVGGKGTMMRCMQLEKKLGKSRHRLGPSVG